MKNILDLTDSLNIPREYILPYGWDKAKIDLKYKEELKDKKDGKLVLVTAITPTKAGEGKTTTTIGLHDGLRRIGVNSLACLREPSLGPVWGIKGGAVGALKSTIVPSDDINLHFTGDFHALTSTINLMAAIIDNHIYQGNELNIDPNRIVWPRALDINDRALRGITINANGTGNNIWQTVKTDKNNISENNAKPKISISELPDKYINHSSEFVITVASELMTILTISQTEEEFVERVNNIIVAYTKPEHKHYSEVKLPNGNIINADAYVDTPSRPVKFGEFNCSKAILKMMRNAMNPNIVQTLEENPVLVHCGPFANISIGVNSINATKMALKMSDVVVTEAGFGGDLGAEKFLDIKCQLGNLSPDAIVLVATVRALKLHGGVKFEDLDKENIEAMRAGECNLWKHAENMSKYISKKNVIIAINRFPSDTDAEIEALTTDIINNYYNYSVNTAALDGSAGAEDLAIKVKALLDLSNIESKHFEPLYTFDEPLTVKIRRICSQIYGAADVEFSDEAIEQLTKYVDMGYGNLPVCISKTPNSLTDDPKILGRPEGFKIHIREVRLYAGAGLIVPLSGALLLMPGLPARPRCLDEFN